MVLLLDIGNTNTHAGVADAASVVAACEFPTRDWRAVAGVGGLEKFLRLHADAGNVEAIVYCCVVPAIVSRVEKFGRELGVATRRLTPKAQTTLRIKYRTPETLGTDRLANAIGAFRLYGAPVVVIGLGTAVVVDVVDGAGCYRGGIIGPGIAMFRDYLHEKTAQLPAVKLRRTDRVIGRTTEEALLAGCLHGFAGMIMEWLRGIRSELGMRRLKVIATGGYADYLIGRVPGLIISQQSLTLEGLRLFWLEAHPAA